MADNYYGQNLGQALIGQWECQTIGCGSMNGRSRMDCIDCGATRPLANNPIAKAAPVDPLDVQVGGGHYKDMKIQPVEFIHSNGIGYIEGNCIKYLCRHKSKNGAEDIKKVIHYCQLLLLQEYGQQ